AAEEFHGHGVDAAVGDPWIQVGIDLLLALDGAERRQLVADHVQLEVAAFTFDFHLGSRNLLFQEILNFYGLHVQPRSAPDAHGRPSYKKARSLRTPALRHLGSRDSVIIHQVVADVLSSGIYRLAGGESVRGEPDGQHRKRQKEYSAAQIHQADI